MTKIVFISGTGRYGTNIMKDILSLHPNVGSHPFEYRFIIDPDGIVDFYSTAIVCWSPYIIDFKLRRLEDFLKLLTKRYVGKKIYTGWELNEHFPGYEKRVDELLNELVDFKYVANHYGLETERQMYFMKDMGWVKLSFILGNFIRDLVDRFLEQEGKKVYVEDNTHSILQAPLILDLLPEAKFIHMVRDPMDVIASLSKQRWAPRNTIDTAKWYKAVEDRITKQKKQIPPESVITVDLYNLVKNPEQELRTICRFLRIPYTSKMLNIDLSKSHAGRWVEEFIPKEIEDIKKILGDDKSRGK